MNTPMTRHLIANAAADFGVPLPDYVLDAHKLADAASTHCAGLEAMAEPNIDDVTETTIPKVIDAVLAYRDRDQRLAIARRIEAEATSRLNFAYERMRPTLLTELAPHYDEAATAFMAAYDSHKQPNPKVTATLTKLVGVRDQLAGRVGEGLPANNLDLPTRIATFACVEDIVNRVPYRTEGLERGSQAWLEALLGIDGCRLKWQTPQQQAEHVNKLPVLRGGKALV